MSDYSGGGTSSRVSTHSAMSRAMNSLREVPRSSSPAAWYSSNFWSNSLSSSSERFTLGCGIWAGWRVTIKNPRNWAVSKLPNSFQTEEPSCQ